MNKNNSLNGFDLDEIDIETIADEQFDLDQSIKSAKEVLEELNNDDKSRVINDFDLNKWRLRNRYGYHNFDFEKIKHLMVFNRKNNVEEIIKRVKCWVTTILRNFTVEWAKRCYKTLIDIIKFTNYFQKNKAEELCDFLQNTSELSNYQKIDWIHVSLNFLDYNQYSILYDIYDSEFCMISESIKIEQKTRALPSPKDMITFSTWIEHFFNTEIKRNNITPYTLRYYPVVIWWKLTSIIPIRPSEFCDIKRDALKKEEDGYYLKLPRIKNNNKTQIIDKILVSKEIGEIINHYIKITKKYGGTKTLISYNSILSTYKNNIKAAAETKKIFDLFTYSVLNNLLNNFHDEILQDRYGLSISPKLKRNKGDNINHSDSQYESFDISKRILPGDTRHLAIMSLIAQKFHPVEVARLAGHTSLTSYYHYSNHKAYWVDLEVQKLITKYYREKDVMDQKKPEKQQLLWNEITERALYKKPTSNYKEKKEIGYCTDNLKRCFTECILCEHWRISFEEFNLAKTQRIIQEKVSEKVQNANELYSDIFNLMKAIDVDKFSQVNPEIKKALDKKLMKIDDVIQQIANLKLIQEENIVYDD